MKAVVHVDLEDESRLVEALANIRNLLDDAGDNGVEAVLVANGAAVRLLQKGKSGKAEKLITELLARGVAFRVCGNALRHYRVERDSLPDAWEVVPAGIVELVRLQDEGAAYVKP
jgi:intracellular sulfur oxidation DsrE/DsrF family protein